MLARSAWHGCCLFRLLWTRNAKLMSAACLDTCSFCFFGSEKTALQCHLFCLCSCVNCWLPCCWACNSSVVEWILSHNLAKKLQPTNNLHVVTDKIRTTGTSFSSVPAQAFWYACCWPGIQKTDLVVLTLSVAIAQNAVGVRATWCVLLACCVVQCGYQ